MRPRRLDSHIIDQARAIRLERVIADRGIELRGHGAERVGPCSRCGAGEDRFSINIPKQVFYCRRCGGKGGGAIDLVMFLDDIACKAAIEQLTGITASNHIDHLDIAGPERPRPNVHDLQQYTRGQLDKARYLFRSSGPTSGTPVETYLRLRGIEPPLPATIRFLPPLQPSHHPAMLVPYGLPEEPQPGALIISEDGITAVQLTLLKPDGSGKAEVKPDKITIASPADMPMVLAPINDLMGLAITEGVEDALSVHRATGLGAWASGGWSFMPKLARTIPSYVEAVTICGHQGQNEKQAAEDLANLLSPRGIEIFFEGISA